MPELVTQPIQNPPPATIVIADIPPDDSDAKFKDEGDQPDTSPVWQDYVVVNRYEGDQHTYMMGITSAESQQTNADTVAFVKLAGKTTLWVCDWTVSRWSTKPSIPSRDPVDSRWVLLDEHIEPNYVNLNPNGITPLWRISGTYIYGNRRPNEQVILDSAFPRPAWMEDAFDRTLNTSLYEDSIKEAQGQVAGGGPQPAPPEFPEFGPVKIPGT